jgi:hypothetical protein
MGETIIALGEFHMRKLAAIALLFSAQAFACPDLTGSFTCTYQDGSSEKVTISQSLVNGVTVYNYNGSEIPADNVARPMQDDQSIKSATFRAWCEASSLKGNLIGKYYNNGSEFGDLNMVMTFALDANNLKSITNGTLVDKGGTSYPLDGEVTCARN